MKYSTAFGLLIILGFIGMGIMHEQVHVAIYNGYGIESEVYYLEYFPDFMTVAQEPCPTEACELAHNINEVVAYPLLIFYIVLMTAMLMIIILLEDNI